MKRFYVFLLFVVSLTYQTNFNLQANVNNLIDTLSILKPERYQYSPLHGAVAWENEWVMKLYDFGCKRIERPAFPVAQPAGAAVVPQEQPQAPKKYTLDDPEHAPALIKLVDALFYRVPGTIGMSNFGSTGDIKKKDPKEVAQAVGGILAGLCSVDVQKIGRVRELAEKLSKESKNPNVKTTALRLCEEGKFLGNLDGAKNILSNTKIPPGAALALEFRDLVEKLAGGVEQVKESGGKLVRGCASLALQAYIQNPQETLLTMLALLWACCKSDRSALAEYYKSLNGMIQKPAGASLFFKDQEPDWDAWGARYFDPAKEKQMKEDLKKFGGNLEEAPQLYEAFMYLLMMPGEYPKLSAHQNVTLWLDDTEHKNVKFTDCMDSSMMNFLLILAYDKESKGFSSDFLKQRLGFEKIDEKLEHFLKGDHPAFNRGGKWISLVPQTVEEVEVHNAWIDVVSNIPGVAYNRCVRDGRIEKCLDHSKGFIIATASTEELSKSYTPVLPGQGICCEFQPSLKNVIVLFNYLFNLNLFDPKDAYTEILKPDFVKTYLPLLAEKLNMDIDPDVSLSEIDAKDYGDEIQIKFGWDGTFPFILHTSSGHGEVSPACSALATGLIDVLNKMPMQSEKLPSLCGIKLVNMSMKDIKKGLFIRDGICNFYDLPWLNVRSATEVIGILRGINNSGISASSMIQGYFMHLAEAETNMEVKLSILIEFVKSLREIEDTYYQEIINIALNSIKDKDIGVRISAQRLFEVLFEKGKGVQEAITAVLGFLKDDPYRMGYAAIELLKALLEKRLGVQEAITAAVNGIKSSSFSERSTSLDIFRELIKRRLGVQEAIKTAFDAMNSSDVIWHDGAFDLFKVLFENGLGVQEAVTAASASMNAPDASRQTRGESVSLFKTLIEGGQWGQDVLEAMLAGVKDPDIGGELIKLFMGLVKKDQGFQEAIKAASIGMQNAYGYARSQAVQLFSALVAKEQGIQEAIKAASLGVKDTDAFVPHYAIRLFEELFKRDQGVQEAVKTALDGVKAPKALVRQSSIELFEALVDKGYGYEEAIDAALRGVDDRDETVRNWSLHLFRTLVKRNRGYEEAIKSGLKCLNDADRMVRCSSFTLFDVLVKQNQGYAEAVKATLVGMEDNDGLVGRHAIELFKVLLSKNIISEDKAAEVIKGFKDKEGAQWLFTTIKSFLKDEKIKSDLEQYLSQP